MVSTQPSLELNQLRQSIEHLIYPSSQKYDKSIGLELEIWPFFDNGKVENGLLGLRNQAGNGIIQLLEKRVGKMPTLAWNPTPEGNPRFNIADGAMLTFEPGGQIEYSGLPKPTIAEGIKELRDVLEKLRCSLKNEGVWFFHSGLNPWHTIDEVGLQLQKERYIHMNNYFAKIGPYGQRMMRLSTSLQVNLDMGNPEEAEERWLAGYLLAPVFTAVFANSPFVDGKASGAQSFRSIIWQNLDPSRSGIPAGFQEPVYKSCPVEQYLSFALNANVMRLPDGRGGSGFDGTFLSFAKWMKQGHNGLFPTDEDWQTHLTTLFPEVRARGFLEMRFLDAQSKVWAYVPGILLTHLIYNTEARREVLRLLEPYRTSLSGMLEVAALQGMKEDDIGGIGQKIYQIALKAAQQDNECDNIQELLERFYKRYTYQRRSPSCDLIDLNDGNLFTPTQYRNFEKQQVEETRDLFDVICDM